MQKNKQAFLTFQKKIEDVLSFNAHPILLPKSIHRKYYFRKIIINLFEVTKFPINHFVAEKQTDNLNVQFFLLFVGILQYLIAFQVITL